MDFWIQHGWVVLVCLALFPRLTLLLGAFVTGGGWWWVGWVFVPHLLVAILAIPFWDSNPVLVICAWLMAFGGSSGEASATGSRRRRRGRGHGT